MGDGGAGYLNAAFGLGGALGDRRHGDARRTRAPDPRHRRRAGRVGDGVHPAGPSLHRRGRAASPRRRRRLPQPVRRVRTDAPPADGATRGAGARLRGAREPDERGDRRRSDARAPARAPRRNDGRHRRHRPAAAGACAPDRPAALRARCVGHGPDRRDRAAAVAAAVFRAARRRRSKGIARSLEPSRRAGRRRRS